MSAGGLSYSGLRTSSKVTLPSIEMWGTNMNILRDPPRSIHTRRVDKVGQTQSILQAQDESGDRICEMINVYARGVNPMVSVSYDNFSNNAGGGNPLQTSPNASLPYKVENVRPPVLRQEDLLPLSRLPRNWFYSYTNPSLPDLVQAAQCNETDNCVHEKILYASAGTNKEDLKREDFTSPREAPRSAIGQALLLSANARVAHPYRTSLREERDTGSEKKSIVLDKRDIHARTNLGSGSSVSLDKTHDFHSIDSGRIQAELRQIPLHAVMGGGNHLLRDHTSDFDKKDPKQIQLNKRLYEAFSNKGRETGGRSDTTQVDTSKHIHKEKYLCIARTNRSTVENFQHPLRDTDICKIATKDFLYTDAQTTPTSVFQLGDASNADKDRKAIIESPLQISGHSNIVGHKRQRPDHNHLARSYLVSETRGHNVMANPSLERHIILEHQTEEGSALHKDILQFPVESARSHMGGQQATEDSRSTFALNPHLYTSVETAKTMQEGDSPHIGTHHELQQKTTGSAETNKTMLGDTNRQAEATFVHKMQEITPVHVEGRRTFLHALSNPLEEAAVSLPISHKTPLHSATTNHQSPFSRTMLPEHIPEQHQRTLHTSVSTTTGTDLQQLENTGDVYQIQSRESRSAPTLQKGGFDAPGNAVPIFDRYGQHEYQFRAGGIDQRDQLRLKTQSMMQDRYPSSPNL